MKRGLIFILTVPLSLAGIIGCDSSKEELETRAPYSYVCKCPELISQLYNFHDKLEKITRTEASFFKKIKNNPSTREYQIKLGKICTDKERLLQERNYVWSNLNYCKCFDYKKTKP